MECPSGCDLRLRETADDRRLTVRDEELVVGAALVEEEAEVAADDVQPRLLGARIVMRIWRLLVMCGVTRRMIPLSLNWTFARAADLPGWRFRRRSRGSAFPDPRGSRRAVIERHDARLGLEVGEVLLAERVEEGRG